jgi:hypothetical protein
MNFESVFEDNVQIVGVLLANQLISGTSGDGGAGTISATGEISGGSLNISGSSSLKNTTVDGSLDVSGSTSINTLNTQGQATLNSANVTNNQTVGGTLGVTGTTTLTNLSVSGNETVGGTLDVTGTTTLTNLSVSGNETVGGTLAVTGATTLSNTLAVTGTTTLSSTLKIPTTEPTNPQYIALATSAGLMGLLGVGSTGQVIGYDGTNIGWVNQTGGGGGGLSIGNWAVLQEQFINANPPLHYTTTSPFINLAGGNTSLGNGNYNRIFTTIKTSSTSPLQTPLSTRQYTYGNQTVQCLHNFTLLGGTYIVMGSFPAGIPNSGNSSVGSHLANLETAGGTIISRGTSEYTKTTSRSIISDIITLTNTTTLLIKHYISSCTNLGFPTGIGTETYGTLMIIRVD